MGDRNRKLEITIEHKGDWRTRMYREHWLRDTLSMGRQPEVDLWAPDWHPPPVELRYEVTPDDGRDY